MKMYRGLFFALISSLLLDECYGTWCYVCSYPADSRCGDEFLMTNLDAVECDGTCLKKRGYTEDSSLVRTVRVQRGCEIKTEETCVDSDTQFGFTGIKCLCNKDYCNKSSSLKGFTNLTFLLTLMTFLYNVCKLFI